ncbi:MAG: hypothetical protein R3C32_08170 [Chloroflexota bacterium]
MPSATRPTARARWADPSDFYAPTSHRFRFDPDAGLDGVGLVLESACASRGHGWTLVPGGGRYALPIARLTRGVVAVDPSPSMLGCCARAWPSWASTPSDRSRPDGR